MRRSARVQARSKLRLMSAELLLSLDAFLAEREREALGLKEARSRPSPLFRPEGQRARGAVKRPGRRFGGKRPSGYLQQVMHARSAMAMQAAIAGMGKNQYKTIRTQMTRGGLPSGINKPFGKVLWTSTMTGYGPRGPKSAWTRWASSERPQWLRFGSLQITVKPSARVLHILKKNEYYEVVEDPDFRLEHPTEGALVDWREIAYEGYDGFHVQEPLIIPELRMWMVETTAWFNWSVLEVPGPIW